MTAHPASDGWRWIMQGIQLFRRNPGEFLALILSYVTAIFLVSIIPVIGQVLWQLLIPACCLGMMQACRQVARGQSVWSPELLTGLQMPHLPKQLKLGSLSLLAAILASLMTAGIFILLDDKASWMAVSGQVGANKVKIDSEHVLLAFIGGAVVYLPFMAALWFAPALVSWHQMSPGKAIFYSFFAIWRSGRAFIIYGLGLIGLFFAGIFFAGLVSIPFVHVFGKDQLISATVTLALLLIIFSIFYCTLYCTYENVFGKDQEAVLP